LTADRAAKKTPSIALAPSPPLGVLVPRLCPHAHLRDRGDRAERVQQHEEQAVVLLPDQAIFFLFLAQI
jgi:hypothetical protein